MGSSLTHIIIYYQLPHHHDDTGDAGGLRVPREIYFVVGYSVIPITSSEWSPFQTPQNYFYRNNIVVHPLIETIQHKKDDPTTTSEMP